MDRIERKCMMRMNGVRKMFSCLGLLMCLGIGQVVAQNEGRVSVLNEGRISALNEGQKTALNEGKVTNLSPKDSISRKIEGSDSISLPLQQNPILPQEPIGTEMSSPSQNSAIFDNPYKKAGISVFDTPAPYKYSAGSLEDILKSEKAKHSPYRFNAMQAVIPASLIILGKIGEESDWGKARTKEIRDELQEHINSKFTIDDFSQYAPLAATYGLNLCGIRGLHGYGDLTIITGTAYAIMGITVNSLKSATKVMRPDGSSRNSFPSGHTATAFMGAELLRREYKDVSPWIGVAGYAVAAGTGFFRMYNNRHWLTDVIAGAGIGIMSVQAAYWLYPAISKTFFRKRYLKNTFISPYLSEEGKGLACNITF